MPPKAWTSSPDEVRSLFLNYFKSKGHEVLPSASLVPENDPSLLFIGAGMAPFKDRFLGRVPLTYRRATTSQKCLRTGDLENVGRTPGHHTFFEMLGNFSFGDSVSGGYGKEDAIRWAWEFLTDGKYLGIPKDRLRVTVYREDDEAAGHWKTIAGLPESSIGRLGAKSNFWPANAPEDGPDGPCGPCSEIFFDLGFKPDPKVACTVKGCPEAPESPDCDCRRYLEIWNLVFQQFDRKGANHLVPLPMKNIDTGAGFERILTVLAHLAAPEKRIYSNFQTELFGPLVRHVLVHPSDRGADSPGDLVAARRIADHLRASVFCIADGVRPSNEGRGYVLRRVIRRAVRDGIGLGIGRPFLHEGVSLVATIMGGYPDIAAGSREIEGVLRTEEERFRQTFEAGSERLRGILEGKAAGFVLPGPEAFVLHDTYGFPVDVTADIVREQGFDLDRAGFDAAMEGARKKSREGSKMAVDIFAAGPLDRVKKETPSTVFLGYGPKPEGADGTYAWDPGVAGASVVAEILLGEKPADRLEPGQEGALVLRESPFYAEAGGQIGDAGEIRGPGGAIFRVTDTKKVEGFHLHLGRLEGAALTRGAAVEAVVDAPRRDSIRRNHTATHLLHRALRMLLGEEARQAGSLVAPDYLRFDFSFARGLTAEERETLESEVNRRVFANASVETRVLDTDAARATGAVSMFGEKYGSRVRVLTAGDSREFCGGTHCRATGDIGSFRILSEKSIGSGVRRIEAVTGERAVREFQEERRRAAALHDEVEKWKKEAAKAAKKVPVAGAPTATVDPMAVPRSKAGSVEFVVVEGDGIEEGVLAGAGDRVKGDAGGPFAALIASKGPEGVVLVAAGNPAAVKAGFKAGAAIKAAAEPLGGGGGGRPDFARGKGKDAARLPDAVKAFEAYLAGL